jgi:DNA-binding NtrC family response regulator
VNSILLVSGNVLIRNLLAQAWMRQGYHVFSASDPREAEALAREFAGEVCLAVLHLLSGQAQNVIESLAANVENLRFIVISEATASALRTLAEDVPLPDALAAAVRRACSDAPAQSSIETV